MRYGDDGAFVPIGRLNYVPAGLPWSARIDPAVRIKPALYCDFEPGFFHKATGIDGDDVSRRLAASLPACGPVISQVMWLMYDELRHPGFCHAIKVEALSRTILVELARHARDGGRMQEATSGRNLSPWQVARIRAFVEEKRHLGTIGEVADLCGISASHFRRVFKQSTGKTFGAFVKHIRMDRARALLAEGKMPLKEIAFRTGFADASAFSTAFNRECGMTPLTCRQMASV